MADAGRFVADALTASGILDADTAIAFAGLFSRYVKQQHSKKVVEFDWKKVDAPSAKTLADYENLERLPDDDGLRHELLKKVAIVKLNGGLGSSMGCVGPKSAIPVRGGLSFLDLTVRQVEYLNAKHGVDIPLVLMNSFRTHADTVAVLNKYSSHNISITCFVQSCFPRLHKDTYTPMPVGPFRQDDSEAWYPPGHGDVWRALAQSGVLEALLGQGKEYIFLSNIDNLAASVDLRILWHLVSSPGLDFAMEVVDRTRGDVQGGTLVEYEGRARLVEQAQVPPEHLPAYKSLKAFTNFNTNNLWVKTAAVKDLVSAIVHTCNSVAGPLALSSGSLGSGSGSGGSGGAGAAASAGGGSGGAGGGAGGPGSSPSSSPSSSALHFAPPVVVNERQINGRTVLELETAAGAAVEFFPRALGIRVPRSRFLPVKSTSDLLAVQSNLFEVKHGLLLPNPARAALPPPVIKLGPEFATLSDYNDRFGLNQGQPLPDLLDLEHLTVQGNVYFLGGPGSGTGIKLAGTVIVVAQDGARIDVPPGSILENKVISGSLRILEH